MTNTLDSSTLLKAATVGCGRMGAFASPSSANWMPSFWEPVSHLPALIRTSGIEPIAAVDISPKVQQRVHATFGIKTYTNLEVLLDAHKIDVLTIATRTPLKAELIYRALDAGVRAFHIEKPLCNTLSELKLLEKALEGVPVTYGCIRRYLSPYRDLSKIASEHQLGNILSIVMNMSRSMLYWTHPHSIDMMLMQAADKPVSVQAVFERIPDDEKTKNFFFEEDPFVITGSVFFENGVFGQISPIAGNDTIVVYDKGSLSVLNDGRRINLCSRAGEDPYPKVLEVPFEVNHAGGTSAAIDLLCRALQGDVQALDYINVVKQDMFLGQKCLFGMAASHRLGGIQVLLSDLPVEIELKGMFNGMAA